MKNADRLDPIYMFFIRLVPERDVNIVRWTLGLTFFFVLGIIVNHYQQFFQRLVTALRRPLIVVALVLAVLSVLTANATLPYHVALSTDPTSAAPTDWSLWVFMYATVMVLLLWSFEWPRGRVTGILEQFGVRSLAIYLIHRPLMQLMDKAIYHAAPQLFTWSFALLVALAVVGVGGPCIVMWMIARSPARRHRRLLFGS